MEYFELLKTAFIGNENLFDYRICEWLSQHTDLKLIIWTNSLSWSSGRGVRGMKKRFARFRDRSRRYGILQTMNEILYFIIYRILFARTEQRKLRKLIGTVSTAPRKPLSQIRQYRASDINSEELRDLIGQEGIDAMFAMCIDVYLPQKLIDTPRLGTYLWHEGITPEYRGVHSPFWVLANQDYSNFGYTVLKLNSKFDAGDIYVQGRIDGIDPMKDLHCYIGHKAIIDSLSPVRSFFHDLEKGNHRPIQRSGAQDQYYSYPTGTKLLKIMANRLRDRIFKKRAKPVKSKKQQKFKRVLSTEPVSAAAALAANETRSAISDTK